MKKLFTIKLAKIIKIKHEDKKLTQDQLCEITGLNRLMIGRIERQNFIPSIIQLQSLVSTLEFEITDMFVDK
ncbi:helix-turn-helix domain-containing protein [Clostridium bowmanii]|uniref:helix-turn-helix domain-containing protein n=1 Tax=Clostridium bowmanii TaxID=132925 RepID=UPI001C0AFBD5|nr:helix-turn-helix transcriptional regulator [Clostridium bowmanii]MBU3189777.1 helix-turn-helix domain-containing protein [Clostridium bowmanii]MCA1074259.1 helix-turn-helix domain-containing protein [Clostridium bowmanii]